MKATAVFAASAAVLVAACSQTEQAANQSAPSMSARSPNEGVPTNAVEPPPPANDSAAKTTNPCLHQDGMELRDVSVKAVGTEPFWAARVEGRCVTYSTPENQNGTRIWTHYIPASDGGTWTGALNRRPFKLVTRPNAKCSDGMSDRSYPMEAMLTVGDEERKGCAEPG